MPATKGIDSNRVLRNLGNNGFAAIGMALAVIGSALGGALTGRGGNTAMDAINRIIDQDIADQRLDRELKLKKAGTIKKDLDAALKDEEKQKTLDGLKRYKYLSAVKSQVQMKMFATNDPKKKAAYKKQLDLIDKQLTKVYGDFTLEVTKFVITEENKKASANAKQNAAAKKEQDEIKKRTVIINGRPIVLQLGTSEKVINEVRTDVGTINAGNKAMDRLLEITELLNNDKLDFTDRAVKAEVATLVKQIQGINSKQLIGPGARSAPEWKILDGIVRNPTDWFSTYDGNKAALQTLRSTINNSFDQKVKAFAVPGSFKKFKSKPQKSGRPPKKGETRFKPGSKGKKEKWDGTKWVPIKSGGASGSF